MQLSIQVFIIASCLSFQKGLDDLDMSYKLRLKHNLVQTEIVRIYNTRHINCSFGIQYVTNAEVRCSSLKVHNIDLGLEIQRKPKEKC